MIVSKYITLCQGDSAVVVPATYPIQEGESTMPVTVKIVVDGYTGNVTEKSYNDLAKFIQPSAIQMAFEYEHGMAPLSMYVVARRLVYNAFSNRKDLDISIQSVDFGVSNSHHIPMGELKIVLKAHLSLPMLSSSRFKIVYGIDEIDIHHNNDAGKMPAVSFFGMVPGSDVLSLKNLDNEMTKYLAFETRGSILESYKTKDMVELLYVLYLRRVLALTGIDYSDKVEPVKLLVTGDVDIKTGVTSFSITLTLKEFQ